MKFEALSKLFLSVFSADELRRFLRFTCGSELVDALPGNGSFATLAEAAVDVLDKRGLVTAALFQALRVERVRRKADIDAVEALWGGALTSPPVVPAQRFVWLTEDEFDELSGTLIAAGLASDLDTLLAGIHVGYVGGLSLTGGPNARLLAALHRMNAERQLADGSVPLRALLRTAASLRQGTVHEVVIRKALARVTA